MTGTTHAGQKTDWRARDSLPPMLEPEGRQCAARGVLLWLDGDVGKTADQMYDDGGAHKLMYGLKAGMAEAERSRMSKKVRDMMNHIFSDGGQRGGSRAGDRARGGGGRAPVLCPPGPPSFQRDGRHPDPGWGTAPRPGTVDELTGA